MDQANAQALWQRAIDFHGHTCPGIAIGYRAALYAMELLGLEFSDDEQVVCITENDACGVDAIQSILGCSVGKGNLLFHLRGKQAFSFYRRSTGQSVRLVLNPRPRGLSREDSLRWILESPPRNYSRSKSPPLRCRNPPGFSIPTFAIAAAKSPAPTGFACLVTKSCVLIAIPPMTGSTYKRQGAEALRFLLPGAL